MMVDYKLYPMGKDGESEPGFELNGVYITNSRALIALARALIKKGVLTRAEIGAEL